MENLSIRDADLNPTTRSYLDELSSATGTSKVALLELSVALLYRQFFGLSKSAASAGGMLPQLEVVDGVTRSKALGEVPSPDQSIQERRVELGLTRVALASAAGVSEGTVRRFEAGNYRPELVSLEMVQKLASGLKWTERQTALALGAKRHL